MRSKRVTVIALAVLALLAGCTKSDDGGTGTTESTRPPGTGWAQRFCTAYDEWVTAVTERLATAQLLNPAEGPAAAHQALSEAAAAARDDTITAVGVIDAAGDPAVPDGPVIAVDIIHAFEAAQQAFTTALSALQSVNPNDATLLLQGAEGARTALVNTLASARNQLASALSEPQADRLAPAFAAAPACDGLFEATAPT